MAGVVLSGPLLRLNTSVPSLGPSRVLSGGLPRNDAVWGGPGRIAGSVVVDANPDVPVRRRVRLYDGLTGALVRETWSAADGVYAFERVRIGMYCVVSHDHTGEYNAAVRDRIEAVLS